jgi:hypothetical protein
MKRSKSTVTIHDYETAYRELGSKQSKTIGNNTYLGIVDNEPGAIAITLHQTRILKFYPDGSIVLNNGGWYTVTTKDRLNDALIGACICKRSDDWVITIGDTDYMYENGMTIKADGSTDVMPYAVYEVSQAADVKLSTIEDLAKFLRGSTVDAIKKLWCKCKYSKDRIAYYAAIEFIPLIIPSASGTEYWYKAAKERLATG